MFVTETLEMHPDFGLTLQQVFDLIKRQDPLGGEYIDRTTYPRTGPGMLCSNPHAIVWVKQHPKYIGSKKTYLNYNKSEEAIYLLRQEYFAVKEASGPIPPKKAVFYHSQERYWQAMAEHALERLEHALLYSNLVTLDTYLTSSVLNELGPYCRKRMYKWLCTQEKAVPFLSKHLDLVDWATLSANPAAIDLLLQHPEHIDYPHLCLNPHPEAIALLRANPTNILWRMWCTNPAEEAVDLLLETGNLANLHPYWLSHNTNPRAVKLLRERLDEINWEGLSKNPCEEAVALLKENPDKIHLPTLCRFASTRRQFSLLREHLLRLTSRNHWRLLCENPSPLALQLLKENQTHIQWQSMLRHHNVFEIQTAYDYAGIREAKRNLHEEYHAWAGHPVRVLQKAKDWGLEDEFPGMSEDEMEGQGGEMSLSSFL